MPSTWCVVYIDVPLLYLTYLDTIKVRMQLSRRARAPGVWIILSSCHIGLMKGIGKEARIFDYW